MIANPVASQFTGGAHRDVMAELSRDHEVEALWPASTMEATVLAGAAVDDGAGVVVAMGGDGLVHHVAQGLIGSDAALALVPSGTTNVVARLFGIPARPTKAIRLIGTATPRSVGTVRLRLQRADLETEHHSLFACGLGLDAEVVRVADSDPYRKYRFGSVHYARSALGVGLGSHASVRPHVALEAGDRLAEASTALVQFRSVYTYFGKIPIRFDEGPDPMSVLVIDRLRRTRVPSVAIRVLFGRDLSKVKGFAIWSEVSALHFTADPPVAIQADGEGLGIVDAGALEWAPDSLRIVAP